MRSPNVTITAICAFMYILCSTSADPSICCSLQSGPLTRYLRIYTSPCRSRDLFLVLAFRIWANVAHRQSLINDQHLFCCSRRKQSKFVALNGLVAANRFRKQRHTGAVLFAALTNPLQRLPMRILCCATQGTARARLVPPSGI